mmetsp:Transcript_46846/g.120706  ORF Transcript_46846/g.120706 Transcript_46846/m.120706 type:complete len:142 (+) Transcript_46846:325-750(+)
MPAGSPHLRSHIISPLLAKPPPEAKRTLSSIMCSSDSDDDAEEGEAGRHGWGGEGKSRASGNSSKKPKLIEASPDQEGGQNTSRREQQHHLQSQTESSEAVPINVCGQDVNLGCFYSNSPTSVSLSFNCTNGGEATPMSAA